MRDDRNLGRKTDAQGRQRGGRQALRSVAGFSVVVAVVAGAVLTLSGDHAGTESGAGSHVAVDQGTFVARGSVIPGPSVPKAKKKRGVDGEVGIPRNPREAQEWLRSFWQDENGGIPRDGLVNGWAEYRSMTADGAGITSAGWTPLGPANTVGGRTRAIAVHPTQPDVVFVGGVSGGIWKTVNAGQSWTPVNDFLATLSITWITFDPTNSQHLYAATGENFGNGDATTGAGIFRSTDGGTTWSQLASTAGDPNFISMRRIAMSANGTILLAATSTGVWRNTAPFTGPWTQVISPLPGQQWYDVDFAPGSSLNAVAGSSAGVSGYSTDGGQTWWASSGIPNVTNNNSGRVEMAYAPLVPTTVYALVDYAYTSGSQPTGSGGLYVSTNGGQSFTFVNGSTNVLNTQGWYDNMLTVLPYDQGGAASDQVVIIGGIDAFMSTNGGATFSQISYWPYSPTEPHADHHVAVPALGFNGTSNRRVYFGNDGGVYRTDDIFSVTTYYPNPLPQNPQTLWVNVNNGLTITQFVGAAGNPLTGGLAGGTQDNSTIRNTAGSPAWSVVAGGDGGPTAIVPGPPEYVFGEYIRLVLHRTGPDGLKYYADYSNPMGSPVAPMLLEAWSNLVEFYSPFALDPNNTQRILAGGQALWRTNDAQTAVVSGTSGPSWTSIKPPIVNPPQDRTTAITAVAVAPSDSNRIWVGHNNGDLYVTSNGTAGSPIWTQVDNGATPLPNRKVTRVRIDPANPAHVYVTFGGFSSANLWETTNGTSATPTWTQKSGMPALPLLDVIQHPTVAGWLYVASEVGILTSENNGAAWTAVNDGPANVRVSQLFFMNQVLYAVTYGRGIWSQTPSASPSCASGGGEPQNNSCGTAPTLVTGNPATGYICPAGDVDWYAFTLGTSQNVTVTFTPPQNPCLDYDIQLFSSCGNFLNFSANAGCATETINAGTLAAGTYRIVVLGSGGATSSTATYSLNVTTGGSCGAEAGEPANNICATAPSIGIGSPANGYICPQGDVDWYTFTLGSTQQVTVALTPPQNPCLDYDVQLFSSCGTFLGFSASSGCATETLSAGNLSAGTYRVVVVPASGANSASASYSLSVTTAGACGAEAGEPANNSCGSASSIGIGSPANGYICPQGDVDWYTFTLGSTQQVTVTLTPPQNPCLDYDVQLFSSCGTFLGFSANSGCATETLNAGNLSAGTYRVVVVPSGGANSASAAYTLSVTTAGACGAEAGEPANNSCVSASPINLGSPANGYICPQGDVDWYTFSLASAPQVTVTLTPPQNPCLDYDVQLYSSCGTFLGFSANSGCATETLNAGTLLAGTYHLVVVPSGGANSASASYALSVTTTGACGVEAGEPANNACASAPTLTLGSAASAYICPQGDVDWFAFTLGATQQVTITLTPPQNPCLDYDVQLFSSCGTFLGFSANGSCGTETLNAGSLAAGTYRVVVVGAGGASSASASYSLTVSGAGGGCPAEATEPNDTCGQAASIPQATPLQRYICPVGDEDWYQFTLSTSTFVNIAMTPPQSPCLDYDLEVHSACGTVVGSSTQGGCLAESLQGVLPAGTYRVRVFGYAGAFSSSASYTIQVN